MGVVRVRDATEAELPPVEETNVHRDARGRSLGSLVYDVLPDRPGRPGLPHGSRPDRAANDTSARLHERGFEHAGTMREIGDKNDRMIDVALYQLVF
jgi:L-amino acid N-acyltransferase YncA